MSGHLLTALLVAVVVLVPFTAVTIDIIIDVKARRLSITTWAMVYFITALTALLWLLDIKVAWGDFS